MHLVIQVHVFVIYSVVFGNSFFEYIYFFFMNGFFKLKINALAVG